MCNIKDPVIEANGDMPEVLVNVIGTVMHHVMHFFEEFNFTPAFFGFEGGEKGVGIVPAHDIPGNELGGIIRQVLKDEDASTFVLVSEGYTIKDEDRADYQANRNKYGSVKNYPGSFQCMLVVAQSPEGSWEYNLPFVDGEKRVLPDTLTFSLKADKDQSMRHIIPEIVGIPAGAVLH